MDFRTFVRVIVTRWKLVAGALVACLVAAGALSAFQTKSYQASATILISFSGETTLLDVYNATEASKNRLSSYAAIAGGHTVAQRAVDQLHVPLDADALAGHTNVTFAPESTLFTITVTDSDPKQVAALAGAMADQFAAMVPTLGAGPGAPVPHAPTAPPHDTNGQEASPATQPDPAQETLGEVSSPSQSAPGQPPLPVVRATVVERPGVPVHPIRPAPMRNMIVGLLAGVLLGVAAALTRNAADRTVHNREQLEQLTVSPTLAVLPGRRGTAPRFGAGGEFDDAMRGLRTRLLRAMGPEARRVLVTAPFGDEGTTTTALNLALSFIELGEKLLLVEGDIRRPVIAGLMSIKSGVGLANVLADRAIFLEAVHDTPVQNLFVLASRTARGDETLPNSAELPDVLADLSERYDRMVVDGPPVLATADTGMLADAVEVTVLVVRAGRTTVDEIKDALHALRSTGTAVVGTVLTDARVSRHTKGAIRTYWRKPYRAKLVGAS
jgi:capsular exopolysaccharide synthesis family protein